MSKLYEQSPTAVIYKDHMGDDNSVVNAARVSFDNKIPYCYSRSVC